MEREATLNAAMHAEPPKADGLELQPFTLAIGQLLEERKNRFAGGANFKPTMREVNELMFVMATPISCLLEIDDENWRREVLRFAATLTPEAIEKIQKHTEAEIERVTASQTTTTGKRTGGRSR